MKIALDAMGGDLAPKATIEGAVLAARELALEIVLVGDRGVLQKELAEHETAGLRLTIEHAAETVGMDDSALEILTKPESSIHAGYDLLRRGEVAAFVGAGNSGAMMTGALAILGALPGVDRPAIGSMVPASSGLVLLIDAGANTDAKAFNLVQFAVMGTVYARSVMGVARPRVGILSNGEEDSKGTDATRDAAVTLRAMAGDINYIGYVEGRDINRGKADVVVTDGFTGNIALKTMEGLASLALGNLRELFTGGMRGRLAYLLLRKQLGTIRERMDPTEYGGAPLLGVAGAAIIAHGSSNPRAIRNALRAAAQEARATHVNNDIIELLAKIPMGDAVTKPAGKGIRALFTKMRERLHRQAREAKEGRADDVPKLGTGGLGTDANAAAHPDARSASSAPRASSAESASGYAPPSTLNGTTPSSADSGSDRELDRAAESADPAHPPKGDHS